jgi:hypothetical protein
MSEILHVTIFGIIWTFSFGTKIETNYVHCTMEMHNKFQKKLNAR